MTHRAKSHLLASTITCLIISHTYIMIIIVVLLIPTIHPLLVVEMTSLWFPTHTSFDILWYNQLTTLIFLSMFLTTILTTFTIFPSTANDIELATFKNPMILPNALVVQNNAMRIGMITDVFNKEMCHCNVPRKDN